MKKSKLTLNSIKVKSFTTQKSEETKGGWQRWSMINCPHTGDNTEDAIGCGTGDPFWCGNQSLGYIGDCPIIVSQT